ncbi:MAG: integrin, partial [Acidobacteriota bacterium]
AYLKASNTDMYDQFGIAVALSGDGSTLAVGAYDESSSATGIDGNQTDNSSTHAGAVYVFARAGASWLQQAYVKASNTDVNDQFGHSLALSYDGSTLAVGAYLEDSAATGVGGNQADNTVTDAGAVYVFARAGTAWSQQAYVKGSLTQAGAELGWGLALSADGNTLAAGAPLEDGSVGADSGAVYVYSRVNAAWSFSSRIVAPNADAGDQFGTSLALASDGSTLVVAAPTEDGGATGIDGNQADNTQVDAGAVYVFVPGAAPATWELQAYVKGSTAITGDFFGQGVALDGDTLAVGAPGDDTLASNGGALYVFTRTAAAWSQQGKLYAPNAAADDQLATTVALAGDLVLAGAALEDGGAAGLDGDQTDLSVMDAGAAYLFARGGTAWSPRTYVKATNPGLGDGFGVSVSLAANGSFAAGAFREDSSTTGVASVPDDAAMDAGAVYVWAY